MVFDGLGRRSTELMDLMKRLLFKDPASRLTADESVRHRLIVVRGKDPFIYEKAKEVLLQFKSYNNKGRLQLALLIYIVNNLMDRRELDYYKEIFFHLNYSFTG